MSVALAFAAAAMFGFGTWLLMQRRLTRIIIGIGLLGHGANLLLLLSANRRGEAAFIGTTEQPADPLPQALALTAIVITFGVTAFLLALAYRSWRLTGDDLVEDDLEDQRIAAKRGERTDHEIQDEKALLASMADERAEAHHDDEETRP